MNIQGDFLTGPASSSTAVYIAKMYLAVQEEF